ncbi:MAG: hypothetical protein LUQ40_04025, partial [Methanomicrobiales archaeon]|nr:hypothetical protein [Methanomicrobiales archaeon]
MKPLQINDEAVSEAIGFIILFGLVTIGIGLVTMYGYPILLREQTNANERNMEQTLIVLQNDVKSLCYKNVPFKETSLSVGGGSLAFYRYGAAAVDANQYFELTVSDGTIDTAIGTAGLDRLDLSELRYQTDSGGMVLAIENGAVMKRSEGQTGSVMIAEPRWFIDVDPITNEKTMVIYYINLVSSGSLSRTGVGNVRMKATVLPMFEGSGTDFNVQVQYHPDTNPANPPNDYATAWKNYFVNTMKMTETGPNT